MASVVYSEIPRCSPDLVADLQDFGVSDLIESLDVAEPRSHLMTPAMRPVAPGKRTVGQAITCSNAPGDNLMIHVGLNVAQTGDVLVLANGGGTHGALWGDVAATFAAVKGIAGVIVDGPIRDIAALREMGSQVWSTTVSPSPSTKQGPGAVNVPIICGGVRVCPGDIIVADDDGVLVVPVAQAAQTATKARARKEREIQLRAKLKAGSTLFDLLNMQQTVERAGVKVIDGAWQPPKDEV